MSNPYNLYNMSAMKLRKLTRMAYTGDKILGASGMSLQIIFISTVVLFNDNQSEGLTTYHFGQNIQ